MASSSGEMKYPPRQYEEGKSPIVKRSINRNCHLANFGFVKDSVGSEAWANMEKSSVGVMIKLAEYDFVWGSKHVHYFLTHLLKTKRRYEMWSLIDTKAIRFSLYEFGQITGLKIEDDKEIWDIDHTGFWREMEVPTTLEGPTLAELKLVLARCRTWTVEKRTMLGLLCILSIAIFGISPTSRFPLAAAKKVMDQAMFDRYPWGRESFRSMITSIHLLSYEGKNGYTVLGCVPVLQIWVYQSVIGLGELYGNRIEDSEEVPLLSWKGSRARINFPKFITEEKEKHGEVRVHPLIVKPEEERYPTLDDDEEIDIKLDTLLKDVLHDRLDTQGWELPTHGKRKSAPKVAHKEGERETSTKKRRNEKQPCREEKASEENVDEGRFAALVKMVHSLSSKVDDVKGALDKREEDDLTASGFVKLVDTLANKMEEKDATVDAKIGAACTSVETKLKAQIASLVDEVKERKQLLKGQEKKEVAISNVDVDDEATSKTLIR